MLKSRPEDPSEAPSEGTPGAVGDGRVSRAQRLREQRRQQILDAARRLFAERGYHATSIHDIIRTADIARGTFYLYFESKRAIFVELLDEFFHTLAGAVRRIDSVVRASFADDFAVMAAWRVAKRVQLLPGGAGGRGSEDVVQLGAPEQTTSTLALPQAA